MLRYRLSAIGYQLSAIGYPYGLLILLMFLLDVSGTLHVYGLGWLMGQKWALAAGMLLVASAGAMLAGAAWHHPLTMVDCRLQITEHGVPMGSRGLDHMGISSTTLRLLTLVILGAWLATAHNVLNFLLPTVSGWHYLWFGAGACGLGMLVVRPLRPALTLGLALGLGVGTRLLAIQQIPLDPLQSDMLPLVQQALANLYTGQSPYALYLMPWELPLTYLPVTWLAYLPADLLGLDLRLTNLVAELVVGGVIYRLVRTPNAQAQPIGLLPLLWAWLFLQPSSLNWALTTTTPIWWALLALTLALVLHERPRATALTLGLGSAASPFAALLWPFVLLARWHSHGLVASLRIAVGAALTAALCLVPFLLWDGPMFRYGVWYWFNDLDAFPRLRWEMDHIWASMVGFAGVFWRRDLAFWLKPIQFSLVIAVLLWFWYQQPSPRRVAAHVAPTLLLFTVFNPVLWPYLYNQGMIAWFVAVASMAHQRKD
ncbi:hypothetical protein [Candidatus Viridilinea mediisalina]|uniref:Glycosyltransferase RgtA/B/C/D-like domain-containing protein n=1 Tax=Candidatus Viridilinea mediisalina TaxID=2024553 RepID=A0A2A6RHI8_9CHLR|nr:hypothetical protein [Candidatus Viridilinea mediisalina]PDW02338.1 hypothetical protein CJ255_14395 [Candidatus Viridilinea mediisalina]